jgi:Kef-type K+ transport system membrane component KefB
MTITGIYCGIVLILIGVAGYGYGLSTGHASPTALIPAAFGLLIALLSAIGRAKESLRMHMMHVAVLIGLIGLVIPAYRVLSNIGSISLSAAVISQLAMAVVCLIFVILCVQSFINARRERLSGDTV